MTIRDHEMKRAARLSDLHHAAARWPILLQSPRMSRFVLLFVTAICVGACGDERYCTLIGCGDSLTFHVFVAVDQPASEFRATIDADGNVVERTCGSDNLCPGGTVVIGGSPLKVTGQFETLDGTKHAVLDAMPTYERLSPNGPECGPTCQVGSLVVMLE